MMFTKKILTASLVFIFIGSILYFVFVKRKALSSSEEFLQSESGEHLKTEETYYPVNVMAARKGDLIVRLKSPGEASTARKMNVKTTLTGIIKSLHVEEGQHVKKGDLLTEFDDEEHKLNFERAEADRLKYLSELLLEKQFAGSRTEKNQEDSKIFTDSLKEYEEARHLYQQGLISENELSSAYRKHEMNLIRSGKKKEEIRAAAKGLTQAEIQVRRAKIDLKKTKIRSPYSGIVTDIKVSPQELILNGSNLFTLVNIDRIQVTARVLESEIGRIKAGREVDLHFSAYPGKTFKGKVKAISPVVNPEDKTCRVIINMDNPHEQIKPGMHAEVEIVAEIYQNRLLVPQEAILVRGGRKLVFTVKDGLAKWKYIKIGAENEAYAEIVFGIEEGEKVIVEGHLTLAHDAKVRIVTNIK